MRTFFKSALCLIFLSCIEQSGDSSEEIPAMDSRATYYGGMPFDFDEPSTYYYLGNYNGASISIIDITTTSENTECNYFAIIFGYAQRNLDYWILSQDMVLHQIVPKSIKGCVGTTVPTEAAILVCDDTAEGNLKDRIDFDSIRTYVDPDWDCKSLPP